MDCCWNSFECSLISDASHQWVSALSYHIRVNWQISLIFHFFGEFLVSMKLFTLLFIAFELFIFLIQENWMRSMQKFENTISTT